MHELRTVDERQEGADKLPPNNMGQPLSFGTAFLQLYYVCIPTHKCCCACHELYYTADQLFRLDFQQLSDSDVKGERG